MTDLNTKEKILQAAIKLFNRYGIANVRLQQIASEVGISTGNLAYHFRNKELIIEGAVEDLIKEIANILSRYRAYPTLLDFDKQLDDYLHFIQCYPFLYLDEIEIRKANPVQGQDIQSQHQKLISQIRKRFDFGFQRGIINPEPKPNIYDDLSRTIWILMTSWFPREVISENLSSCGINCLKSMIWNQIYPYFTLKGIEEFQEIIVPISNNNQ